MTTSDPALAAYRDKLLLALRLREVPGDRIGEVLAEVEAHVAETGEDPAEAFGPPHGYADRVVGATGGQRPWSLSPATAVHSLLIGVASFAATALTTGGVSRWWGDGGDRFGLSPGGQVGLGLAILALVVVTLVRYTLRTDDPVIDPRTGRPEHSGAPWLPTAVFTGSFVLVVLLGVGLDRLTS